MMNIDNIKAYFFFNLAIKRTIENESASAKGLKESDVRILAAAELFFSHSEPFSVKELQAKLFEAGRSLHLSYLSTRIKELEQFGHLDCVYKRKMISCLSVSTPNRYALSMKGRYFLRTLERNLKEHS
ncbi:hypothetical protein D770_15025 [Flammeovirgaceae bacterium 311]|nr:hypothetical protein D770_15025 [Flammeovirgaceae bacterium 311]